MFYFLPNSDISITRTRLIKRIDLQKRISKKDNFTCKKYLMENQTKHTEYQAHIIQNISIIVERVPVLLMCKPHTIINSVATVWTLNNIYIMKTLCICIKGKNDGCTSFHFCSTRVVREHLRSAKKDYFINNFEPKRNR